MVRIFVSGAGDWISILGRVIPKTQKWYLMPPCLTLRIMYSSKVSGAIWEKELRPPLHLIVVAIEKGAFGSPSSSVGQPT